MHLGSIEHMFDAGRSAVVVQKEIVDRLAELDELLSLDRMTEQEVAEAAVEMERLRSMVEARCARTAGLLEASKAWVADGARSAKDWLAWRTHLPAARVHGSLRCARQVRDLPGVEAAWLAGDLSEEHVRLLAKAAATKPDAFAASGEALLVDEAQRLFFSQWAKVVTYWCHRAAADDAEHEALRRYEERAVHCSRTLDGTVVIDAVLDPAGGAVVARELDRLSRLLFEEDLEEARARLGQPDPPLAALRRTAPQRRADALRTMAERSAAKPPGATEPRVLLHVLAGTEAVERMCELSTGTVLTPGEVLPWLVQADVERVVFDGPSKVVDIGQRRRFFTGPTRTAVQLRDLGCTHPTCQVPFEQCEIDHIVPHALGGPTTQENGRCRCKFHHRRARDG
jgi:hypothetical protein